MKTNAVGGTTVAAVMIVSACASVTTGATRLNLATNESAMTVYESCTTGAVEAGTVNEWPLDKFHHLAQVTASEQTVRHAEGTCWLVGTYCRDGVRKRTPPIRIRLVEGGFKSLTVESDELDREDGTCDPS